mgnify:CR=1 FL=1
MQRRERTKHHAAGYLQKNGSAKVYVANEGVCWKRLLHDELLQPPSCLLQTRYGLNNQPMHSASFLKPNCLNNNYQGGPRVSRYDGLSLWVSEKD